MKSLYLKEINGFFNNLTGYIIIIVFLLVSGLFLWVFPGVFNVLDVGYSSLDSLFNLAPWLFLFLVPALSMRMFADEKKAGTLDLLLTRPVSDFKIVIAKYLAALSLVAFSLLPTLIYYITVYYIGNPVGNIDVGSFWGSYIGLFLLAAVYVSIGIFSSSLTDNQVVAFILAVLISFLMLTGFDFIGGLFQISEAWIIKFGINEHYKSISRGVLDSRDLIYFLSVIFLFVTLTRFVLQKRKW